MALVIDAGVGHPVGVFGVASELVILPCQISSASRTGTSSEPIGSGPAPERPGTVESIVFANMPMNKGFSGFIIPGFDKKTIKFRFSGCIINLTQKP
jgi:hypothetical protein